MPKPFNLAVVGYGYVGRTFHAPLIASTPGLQLHSVVSSKPQQPQADFPGINVVADLDSALADPALDAVVLATPNQTHAPFALQALAAGKHVLVDKPFALDVAQAQQMVDAANAAGRIISVFQNRRWDADFLTVRRLIEEGQLGDVMEFHSHFDRYRPQIRDRWRESESPGAGFGTTWARICSIRRCSCSVCRRASARTCSVNAIRHAASIISTSPCTIRGCARFCMRARSWPIAACALPSTARAAVTSSTGWIRRKTSCAPAVAPARSAGASTHQRARSPASMTKAVSTPINR